MKILTLDLLRHGEPIGGKKYRGNKIDDSLSESGWRQMKDSTGHISDWDQIISSPLLRCSEFSRWLSRKRSIPMNIIDDLKEIGFGDWEGKTKKELMNERSNEYENFFLDPVKNRPKNAESIEEFSIRISGVLQEIINTYMGQHLLIVAHAGVIRAMIGNVIKSPPNSWYKVIIDNGSISRLTFDKKNFQVNFINWNPMLSEDIK